MNTYIIPSISYEHEFDKKMEYFSKIEVKMVRINFGRGSVERNIESVNYIYNNHPNIRIAIDLPGNKSRLNSLKTSEIRIKSQEEFKINVNNECEIQDEFSELTINMNYIGYSIEAGDIIQFGDNDLKARVVIVGDDAIHMYALTSGKIKSKSGILIKEKYRANNGISKEELYIASKTATQVDEVFLSFADTVQRIKLCKKAYPKQKIISKIETPQALKNIELISRNSEGLMLARGDLQNHYSLSTINTDILDELFKHSKRSNCLLYVATNYFETLKSNNFLSKIELQVLEDTLVKKPDYILINESCYSNNWFNICNSALLEIDRIYKIYLDNQTS